MTKLSAAQAIASSPAGRRIYFVGYSIAISLSFAAACLNWFIGPFNPKHCIPPLVQIFFAVFTQLILVAKQKRRILHSDPSFDALMDRAHAWSLVVATCFFRFIAPVFFVVMSTIILLAAMSNAHLTR